MNETDMSLAQSDHGASCEQDRSFGGFAFIDKGKGVMAPDSAVRIPGGTFSDLPQRLAKAFSAVGPDAVIGGAMPYAPDDRDCLLLAERTLPTETKWNGGDDIPLAVEKILAEPDSKIYANAVTTALARMESADALRKVVLARTLKAVLSQPIDQRRVMHRLSGDPAAVTFRVALPGDRALIGATPELLLKKHDYHVSSLPLAGSSRRNADPAADRKSGADLLASDKNLREHRFVTEHILDTLSPFCRSLSVPGQPELIATQTMWHLGTRIEGVLKDRDISSAVLAAALHPTPAICGVPHSDAAALINQLEPVPRDFYSGIVGWCNSAGDGAWYVAIRCAEIVGRTARLYAGAGIVPGSDPQAETAETFAKFRTMLTALGPFDRSSPGFPNDYL